MSNIFDARISIYRNAHDNAGEPGTLGQFLFDYSESNAAAISAIRLCHDKAERTRLKAALPAATISGYFYPTRSRAHLVQHSGLLAVDIDAQDNVDIDMTQVKRLLSKMDCVAYAAYSVSGAGLFAIIPIAYPNRHKAHFEMMRRDFMNLNIIIDGACSDVTRLRYVSWDSEPYINQAARVYSATWEQPRQVYRPRCNDERTPERVAGLVIECERRHLDITANYSDWVQIGFALASLGEDGREPFHRLSAISPKYDAIQCDSKFDGLLKDHKGASIGTLFYIARSYGL